VTLPDSLQQSPPSALRSPSGRAVARLVASQEALAAQVRALGVLAQEESDEALAVSVEEARQHVRRALAIVRRYAGAGP